MFKNSKLSRYKVIKIVEYFCIDIDATKTALLLKLNRKTVNRYFLAFRNLIYKHQISEIKHIIGGIEICKNMFGPDEAEGRAPLKPAVFGIYERDGAVYTKLVTDESAKDLQAVIRGKATPESIVKSDGWPGYDGLVDLGYDKHFRINKDKQLAGNAIEAFWSFAKRRLSKFNGVTRNFELHLKECEWRYGKELPELIAELQRMISKNKNLMV